MKKLLVALYDTRGYMKSLTEYFARKSFLIESRLFTKKESLADFLKEHSIDVLLLGQEVGICQLPYLEHAGQVIIMSEGDLVAEYSEYPLIFKYQSAEKILREIFRIVSPEEDFPTEERGCISHTEFVGIYRLYGEPLSGETKNFVMRDTNKKSLFINLELLDSINTPQSMEGIRGMSEVVFYLKQHSSKLSFKLRALIQQWEGIDYLCPVEDYRDLYSLCREDIDRLLAVLANETEYERIVFDIGFLNDSALYLLYCCDSVYMPAAHSSWEENQKQAWERLLVREGLEDVLNIVQYIPEGDVRCREES